MGIDELLQQGIHQLQGAGVENAEWDAWCLLESVTGISRARYLCERKCPIDDQKVGLYFELIQKRATRIPLQYILGMQEFMGLPFLVNEHVLVPRQDTEVLAEEALKFSASKGCVLDMCTGSGCIIISIKKYGGAQRAVGVDLSENALLIAQQNAKRNHVEVEFLRSDMFTSVNGRFDLIVSNPPYIESAVIEMLSPEVRDHEPRMALDGAKDGLYFYHILAEEMPKHLKPNGKVLLEIGASQAKAVTDILKKSGFENIQVKKDLAGLERVIKAEWKP